MKIDKTLILNKIKSYLNIKTDKEFAIYLGIKPTALSMWHKRNTMDIELIFKKCDFLNSEWLLTGNGEMLKNTINEAQEPIEKYNTPGINKKEVGVPFYDVDFIGGFDLVLNDQTVNPSYYIDFPPFNDADCWVNLTGKSMSPFISHGDIVALKEITNWEDFLLYGEIYAIVTNDFRTVKIISKSEKENCLKLIPYNKSPEFVQQDLPTSFINKIFAVKGSIKKFF